MAWRMQSVLNVGVQILLIVFSGWCFPRFGLAEAQKFLPQINIVIMRVAFPALNMYLLGIKMDMKDAEAWRALAAYILWVAIIQTSIVAYTWMSIGRNAGDAGLLNLILTANNTAMVGLPLMQATFPDLGSRISLLTAFIIFLQVFPFSITAFELEKFLAEEHVRARAAAGSVSDPPHTPTRELSGRFVRYSNACDASSCDAAHGAHGTGVHGHGRGHSVSSADPVRKQPGRDAHPCAATCDCRSGNEHTHAHHLPLGAVGRGWAPGTPQSSFTASRSGSLALPSPVPAAARAAAAEEEDDRPEPLVQMPLYPGAVSAAAAAAASTLPAAASGAAKGGAPGAAAAAAAAAAQDTADFAFATPVARSSRGSGIERGVAGSRAPPAEAAVGAAGASVPRTALTGGAVEAKGAPGQAARSAVHAAVHSEEPLPPAPEGAALAPLGRAASGGVTAGPFAATAWGQAVAASEGGAAATGVQALPHPHPHPLPVLPPPPPAPTPPPSSPPPPVPPTAAAQAHIDEDTDAENANDIADAVADAQAQRSGDAGATTAGAIPTASIGIKATVAARQGPTQCSGGPGMGITASAEATPPGSPLLVASSAQDTSAHSGKAQPAGGSAAQLLLRRGSQARAPEDLPPRSGAAATATAAAAAPSSAGDTGSGEGLARQQSVFPPHWPPLDFLTTGGGGGGDKGAGAGAAGSTPPSQRLLSPQPAMTCDDLPVGEAHDLSPSALQGDASEGRLLYTTGSGGGVPVFASASARLPRSTEDGTAFAPRALGSLPASFGSQRPQQLQQHSGALKDPQSSMHAAKSSRFVLATAGSRRLIRDTANSMAHSGRQAVAFVHWHERQLQEHRRILAISWIVLKNPLLWSMLVALLINVSGLREVLYSGGTHYQPELAWVAGTLAWLGGITVPAALFSNGVWLHGKTLSRSVLLRACRFLAIKLLVLCPLQLACAAAVGLAAPAAMSLILLSTVPVASTSFVLASQYGHDAEVVTAVTVMGIIILVPAALVVIALPEAMGLYSYDIVSA